MRKNYLPDGYQSTANTTWKNIKTKTLFCQIMRGLTKKQAEVYNYIYMYNYNRKKFPTLHKMAIYFMKKWEKPLNFQVMDYYMKMLYTKGYIIKIRDQRSGKIKYHFTYNGIDIAYHNKYITKLFYEKHKKYISYRKMYTRLAGYGFANAMDKCTRSMVRDNQKYQGAANNSKVPESNGEQIPEVL